MELPCRSSVAKALIAALLGMAMIAGVTDVARAGMRESLAVPAATALRADPDPVVRSPDAPRYRIRLRTGPSARRWSGRVRISFRNPPSNPNAMPRIHLRLWSNGVLGCGARSLAIDRVRGGTMGSPTLRCTRVRVRLDTPLAPGERATISLRLRIQVPNVLDRFGRADGLSLLGTAIPTLEVHDDNGWNPNPFENLGESFYSVAGRYRARLDVPAGVGVAATGVPVRAKRRRGRVIRDFRAADVRDFAWAAGPMRSISRRASGTRVVVHHAPGAVSPKRARRALRDAAAAMATFDDAFGPYPYPRLDVVLTSPFTFGGMEYPTIVFTEPDRATIAHEVAHQWWYGLVGNDEYASPWLDESFASWAERLPWGTGAGHACGEPSLPGGVRLTASMAYWAANPGRYHLVYAEGDCMLEELSELFGREAFLGILRDYADDHRYGVVRPADFATRIEEAADAYLGGFDAAAFWDRWHMDV